MNRQSVPILLVAAFIAIFATTLPSAAKPAAQATATVTVAATDSATAAATVSVDAMQFTLFNLNTGTSDQFLTIPGMNDRMVREYNEYRPYTSILQFRKEIGKYVGAEQTAAWEKYIYVPIQVDATDAETLKQIPGVDDVLAKSLLAAEPFGSNEAFLTKLAASLTAQQVIYAAHYLDGTVTIPASVLAAVTPAATSAATSAATAIAPTNP